MNPVSTRLKLIVESGPFNHFIIAVIIFAGILVGAETYPGVMREYGDLLHLLDSIVLWIFVAEVVMKMGAEGRRPWRYFYDNWNVFDFIIVAICFVPAGGQYALVLRMARLFRVLRLVRFIPRLQILVTALLKSLPSMVYVSMLLSLLFYMYAVAGTFLFAQNDPVHFGTLHQSMLSLFRIVTLEDWTDIMYTAIHGCDVYGFGFKEHLCTAPQAFPVIGPLYFVSFVLIGTMIVLNLFIGVIMSGMDEATAEAHRDLVLEKLQGPQNLRRELQQLDESLKAVQEHLDRVREWAEEHPMTAGGAATDGVVGESEPRDGPEG